MPSRDLEIEIQSGQRAIIVGTTGSGKTVLARYLLRSVPRLVVLDPKGTLNKWGLEEWGPDSRERLAEGEAVRVRVALEAGEDSDTFWEKVLREVYQAAWVVVYIDEIYGVNDSTKPGRWLNAIWTRGREFGITGIGAAQRPVNMPRVILTEAEHYFTFTLRHPDDREYMAKMVAPELKEPIPDQHGFWYFDVRKRAPVYVKSLPREFRRNEPPPLALDLEDSNVAV